MRRRRDRYSDSLPDTFIPASGGHMALTGR